MTEETVKIGALSSSKKPSTRPAKVRDLQIGGGAPVSVQSMCATPTKNIEDTLAQVHLLEEHGADLIRIAIDGPRDVKALQEIRSQTDARLVVDIQESYRLAEKVAPYVDKIRYNPGHLHHHEKSVPVIDKVRYLAGVAREHDCAVRIGVNFGSLDPNQKESGDSSREQALRSAGEHVEMMERIGFSNFVVSLKSSNPNDVIDINIAFRERFPEIPLHLGVTEAGMLPMGEIKSRIAFENLLANGIGDTLRVSLTLPYAEKFKEINIGRAIINDVSEGRFRSVPRFVQEGLNIISCPSCSRVENEAFIELAERVKEMSQFAAKENLTIAVMGCRVNGPGETDDADLGLWCAPKHVNLKLRGELLGAFSYDQILPKVRFELERLVDERRRVVESVA